MWANKKIVLFIIQTIQANTFKKEISREKVNCIADSGQSFSLWFSAIWVGSDRSRSPKEKPYSRIGLTAITSQYRKNIRDAIDFFAGNLFFKCICLYSFYNKKNNFFIGPHRKIDYSRLF